MLQLLQNNLRKPKVLIQIIKNAKRTQNNLQKPKVLIQIIRNAKRNGYKQTNKQTNTDILDPYNLFSRGLRRSTK